MAVAVPTEKRYHVPAPPDITRPAMEGAHENMVINMGPHHPSTHGVLRLVVELDGETVVNVAPDIGFLHTGIEKTMESKMYQKAVVLTDRTDYLAPLSNNLSYVLAVETLLDCEIPERVNVIRVLLAELTRLNSHLVWLGTHVLDLGATSMFMYGFREREQILDISGDGRGLSRYHARPY
jgi:NADH-quinone oxidoreductase subunit D